jgi:hypothetical protein
MTIRTESCLLGLGGLCPGGWATVNQTTIGARTALPTAAQLGLSCTPTHVSLAPGAAGTVTCSLTGLATLEAPVTVTELRVVAPPGWAITAGSGSVSGTTLTVAPNAVIATSTSYDFAFTLSPSCASAVTPQVIDVTSTFAYRGTTYPGPATTVTGTLVATPGVPSVSAQSVDFGTLVWEESGYPTVRQQLTLRVQVPDGMCSTMADAWQVQIRATALAGPGGATIPASAMVYEGSTGAVPAGVTATAGQQPLSGSGMTIATGTAAVPNGSSWSFVLALTPPSDAPPGVYGGEITLDVVSAGP